MRSSLQIGQIDEHLGRCGARFHDVDERLSARQGPRAVVRSEEANRLLDASGAGVLDLSQQHAFDHIHKQLEAGMFSAVAGFDAVFVGSGVNSLTGAALLARGGWQRLRARAQRSPRRRLRTSGELTAPGFTHELMASWHPLFAGSAAYAELGDDLTRHGLEYLNTDLPTGALFPDGGASFLTTSLEDNAAEFARHAAGDGAAWERQFEQFMASAEHSFGVLSAELWSLQGLDLARKAYSSFGRRGLLDFAGRALVSARDWLEATFESERAHGLLAPWVLHTGLGPEQAVSGFMTQVIACAIQLGGMPVPSGGGVRLVEALAGVVRENGGELRTGADVERVLVSGGRAVRRAAERRRGRPGVARRDRERHPAGSSTASCCARTRPRPRRLAGRAGLPLRPRRHADPPRARRAAASGSRPRPSASRARPSCTSRPASTASRARSTRPSAACCRPRPRSSSASPAPSTSAARRSASR